MGYTTDFDGEFTLDKPLSSEHYNYLVKFNETRRMKRDAAIASNLSDNTRLLVQLPIGEDGEYFVGGAGFSGQDRDNSILNYNSPPSTQPGLWCQWVPNEDGTAIKWDEGEKFYDYIEWIQYLIDNFLEPWGYKLNGEVSWSGEDRSDTGIIKITDNIVEVETAETLRLKAKKAEETLASKANQLKEALESILYYKNNPIRRNKYAGNPDYKSPDWIQTKNKIFEIAEKALK